MSICDHLMKLPFQLKVDRIKFCIEGTHCPLCADAMKTISAMFWNSGTSASNWTFTKQTKPHFQYAHVTLNAGAVAHLKYGQSHGTHKAFIQFNPATIAATGWKYLNDLMADFFQQGYGALTNHARVCGIDYACDVPQATFAELYFIDTRLQKSKAKFEGGGTMYIGSFTGCRELRIYDKQAQLNKVKTVHEEALLRIEASLKQKVKLTLAAMVEAATLQKLANPFASLCVLPRSALQTACLSGAGATLAALVADGMNAQLAYRQLMPINSKKLAALKAQLTALAPAWWKPAVIWSQCAPALLTVAHPSVSVAAANDDAS